MSSSTGTRLGAATYRSPARCSESIGTSSSRRRPSPALSRSPARSKSWVSAAISPQASDTSSEALLPEFALEDLSGLVAGQALEELHIAGNLVAGKALLDVLLHR